MPRKTRASVLAHGAWFELGKVIAPLAAYAVGGAEEGAERSHPGDHAPIVTAPHRVVDLVRAAFREAAAD